MPRINRGPRLEPNERGIYEIRWTQEGRSKRLSTGCADAAQAADAFRVWKSGVEREAANRAASTVRALMDAYFTEHVNVSVVGQDIAHISRRYLLSHFGDMDPLDIHPVDVRAYTRKRRNGEMKLPPLETPSGKKPRGTKAGRPVKDATIRRELSVLIAALNHAVKEKRLKKGDLPSIPLPEPSPPRERWMTEAEVERMFAKASETRVDGIVQPVEIFVHLGYYTAGRRTALCELEWSGVDWEQDTIDLRKAGRRRMKNKRRATVHMHPTLRKLLTLAYLQRGPDNPLVAVTPHAGRRAFERLMRDADLPGVTPHVLRHTAATHMLRRGVPIWKVAGVLGDTVTTVQRVYGHHVPEAMKEAVEALL